MSLFDVIYIVFKKNRMKVIIISRFLLFVDFTIITMLSSITHVSLSSNNTSTYVMMWPSGNIQNITKYRVMISSSQYGHAEINTSLPTPTIILNYSSSYNISISQSACAVERYSVFTLGICCILNMRTDLIIFMFSLI